MILVKERTIKSKRPFKNGFKKKIKRIYVNTLVPQFQFKNKQGEIVEPSNVCINL